MIKFCFQTDRKEVMKRSNAISFTLSSKRKCGLKRSSLKSKSGILCFQNEENESKCSGEPLFVSKIIALEDTLTVANRLKSEGNTLAENSRFWEALSKFKKALELLLELKSNGSDDLENNRTNSFCVLISVLHELCSQCYSELGEVYPAVESAEKAVNYNKSCYLALQTLTRAQINIGELYLAKKSIQCSVHLDPSCSESWTDLKYVLSLTKSLNSTSWSNLPVETRPGIVCQR